jgi:gluconate 2-dehydrogenase gamma chain
VSRSADVLDERAYQTLTSLIADVFPPDAHSPSAEDLGIIDYFPRTFLRDKGDDRQWYRSGPFAERATPELGWQAARSPAEYFIDTLHAIDAACEARRGVCFAALSPEARAQVIEQLDRNTLLEDAHPPTSVFLRMLCNGIQESILRDPIFGGNRDYRGWEWLHVESNRSPLKMRVRR